MKVAHKIKILDLIETASDAQVDALWAIIKYKEIGIFRKIHCIAEVFGEDVELLLSDLPQDEEGRILDHKTRYLIHDALMEVS